MSNFTLTDQIYLYLTPAGAYYLISADQANKPRKFLTNLLLEPQNPALTISNLQRLMETEDEEACLELLYYCQNLGWLQGLTTVQEAPTGTLEQLLPTLLRSLCINGKVLLADKQGFYLASHGFTHEVAEEISALSADIASIQERRTGLLVNNLGLTSQAWGIVDVYGNSQLGFWPVFIGSNRFVIAISGVPHFNQPEFVSLVWALTTRYTPATPTT